MKRNLEFLIMIGLLLVLIAPLAAQEAPTPEPVGLRADAPTYALHGPYWVGTTMQEAEAVSHPTIVTLWYPALNPAGQEERITYDWRGSTVFGHAIEGGEPARANAPYPLVIFSHGANGMPIASPYLLEHLASWGFVIMAIDHTDSSVNPSPEGNFSAVFTRPQDVSWEIDFAESLSAENGSLASMIDADQVAVIGHSFGGETALLAAGAQVDFGPGSWCDVYPNTLLPPEGGGANLCPSGYAGAIDELATVAGLESAPEGLWPSWGDPRVDAIVPLAPGFRDFSAESFAQMTVPTMVMFGTADKWVHTDWPLYAPFAFEQIGSPARSLVEFVNSDHLIFTDKCDTMPWLIDMGASFFCSDPVWDMDRAHDLVNHFTTAFLLDVLKGDADAHAALAPDAVSFPGIEYQAEGFQ